MGCHSHPVCCTTSQIQRYFFYSEHVCSSKIYLESSRQVNNINIIMLHHLPGGTPLFSVHILEIVAVSVASVPSMHTLPDASRHKHQTMGTQNLRMTPQEWEIKNMIACISHWSTSDIKGLLRGCGEQRRETDILT